MASIANKIAQIRQAIFGKDVRESLASGLEAVNDEVESTTSKQEHLEDTFNQLVINAGNSNAEIVDARVDNTTGKSYGKVGDRLDEVSAHMADKANQSYVDSKFGNMGNTKKFKGSCTYATLPTSGNTVDDYWYVTDKSTNYCWNDTSWVDIGNNLKIGDKSIVYDYLNPNVYTAEIWKRAYFEACNSYQNGAGTILTYTLSGQTYSTPLIRVTGEIESLSDNTLDFMIKVSRNALYGGLANSSQISFKKSDGKIKFDLSTQLSYTDVNVSVDVFLWVMNSTQLAESQYIFRNIQMYINNTLCTIIPTLSQYTIPESYTKYIDDYSLNPPVMSYEDVLKNIALNNINNLYGKTFNVIGDSMVHGHSLGFDKTWAYKLGLRNNMSVRDYGINGNCLAGTGIGSGESMVTRYTSMNDNADYVAVFGGTNDQAQNIPIGSSTDNTADTFKGALNVLCSGLITKYPTSKIFFITPYHRNNAYIKAYVDAIIEICGEYGIPVFDNYRRGGITWTNATQVVALTMNDNYHLNEAGHQYASTKYEAFMNSL